MSTKITPGFIMNQIRDGVRANNKANSDISSNKLEHITYHDDQEVNELINKLNINFKRLNHRITPNMPVAFLEPRLVSRFKIIGKIIVPIRKFGARLFTKWYSDTFSHQQKHLNNDIWYGLNATIDIINDQNHLISYLIKQNLEKTTVIEELRKENNEFRKEINDIKTIQKEHASLLEDINKIQENLIKKEETNFNYSKFAERFSAGPDDVKRIYSQYIKHFKNCNSVLDIGCGKGYFLELLRENNINGIGIDTDPDLINACRIKGLNAFTDDAINYLENSKDSSIDGIFMGHVIEHLPLNLKIKFLRLCFAKLVDNGVLVIETPNTTSPFVMHNLYYLDPTHEKPLFPEAIKHLGEMAGFSVVNSYLSEQIIDASDPIEYYNYSLILNKKKL